VHVAIGLKLGLRPKGKDALTGSPIYGQFSKGLIGSRLRKAIRALQHSVWYR